MQTQRAKIKTTKNYKSKKTGGTFDACVVIEWLMLLLFQCIMKYLITALYLLIQLDFDSTYLKMKFPATPIASSGWSYFGLFINKSKRSWFTSHSSALCCSWNGVRLMWNCISKIMLSQLRRRNSWLSSEISRNMFSLLEPWIRPVIGTLVSIWTGFRVKQSRSDSFMASSISSTFFCNLRNACDDVRKGFPSNSLK